MDNKKEYYAFISYKREDQKWAEWLQKKLEHYRFPANLNGRTDLPKTIHPTFRDVSELASGVLADEIDKALRNSEWLIVICSPRSAKSPWVCKEAQTFIDLGRANHIIPFIIEGKPFSKDETTECFPKALLELTGDKELLAININEMGRDAAAIKVVAHMFNLKFDILWQRHERELRRKRWIWGIVAFLMALLGIGVAVYILLLNNQLTIERDKALTALYNVEQERNKAEYEKNRANQERTRAECAEDSILCQYNIIKSQHDSINRSNIELKETQWSILRSQSIFVANKALEIASDNSYLARKIALQILPKNICNPDRPYTSEAELLLRSANKNFSAYLHPDSDTYRYADISSDNHFVVALSSKKAKAYVYDTYTGCIKNIFHLDSVPSCVSISDNCKKIACGISNGYVYVWSSNKDWQWFLDGYFKVACGKCNSLSFNRNGQEIVACVNDSIFTWNRRDKFWVCSDTLLGHSDIVNSVQFGNPDNKILSASNDCTIRIWENKDGKWICLDTLDVTSHVSYADFGYNNMFIASANSAGQINIWEYYKNIWSCKDTIITTNDKGVIYYPYEVNFRPKYSDQYVASYYSFGEHVVYYLAKNFISGATGQIEKNVGNKNNPYMQEWSVLKTIPGDYSCVKWSSDGNNIISVKDGVFISQLYSPIPPSKKMKLTEKYSQDSLIKQGYSVQSPNGKYYIKYENNFKGHNNIYVCNTADDKHVDVLSAWNDKWYAYVLFSPEGDKIVSVMKDKTVRVWEFTPLQELIDYTLERFKDCPLTLEERQQYYLE